MMMSVASTESDGEDDAAPYSPTTTEGKASISGSSDYESQSSYSSSLEQTARNPAYDYAAHQDYIDSNDTLRVMPPSSSSKVKSKSKVKPTSKIKAGTSPGYTSIPPLSHDKPLMIIPPRKRSLSLELRRSRIEPAVAQGVAKIAAQSVDETLNTKRTLIASLATPQQGWSIMQGKQDEVVEEQFSALGLQGLRISENPGGKASEISRTPSQSTTGTIESSNLGSLNTTASSLQSGISSNEVAFIEEKDHLASSSSIPAALPASVTSAAIVNPPPRRSSFVLQERASSSEDLALARQQDSTNALRRYHALLELVETEKGYAEDLATLVHVFFYNLNTQAFFEENEARLKAVCRNADDLLDLHTKLTVQLSKIIEDCNVSAESEGTDLDKAYRCEEAVIQVAQRLSQFAIKFEHYQIFCSRHAEALVLIREAEKRHNGDDFASFERLCGNQLRTQRKRAIAGYSNSIVSSRRSSVGTSTPLATSSPFNLAPPTDDSHSGTASGSTTPSGSFASVSRQTSGRLLFADYLIKPIQRLCLYPLVLNSLLKYTPLEQLFTRKALESAILAMRQIADDVDKASKQREQDLMGDLLVSKIEVQSAITQSFLRSLGNPRLSGSLDMCYHHDVISPLAVPIRFHRLGVILWDGFLLLVRVRKNQQMDCKYWFPLSQARVSSIEEVASPGTEIASWGVNSSTSKSPVPFPLRVSYYGHHFEFSSSSERERQIWHQHLTSAIEDSPSFLEAIPCSLSGDPMMLNSSGSESLFRFFSLYNGVSSSSLLNGSSKSSLTIPDNIVKFPSASNRAAVDRNMIYSNILLSHPASQSGQSSITSGLASKDISEALVAQQLRQNAPPSIGSAVGAAIGLARMAATQMPTAVKRARRQSMLNLTEITPACDLLLADNANALEKAPSKESTNPSPRIPGVESPGEGATGSIGWKNGLLRRGSRVFGGKSPNGSIPPSPFTSTTDLSQTLEPSAPLMTSSPQREDGNISPARQPPVRSRTMSLRDIWQTNFGARRVRSDSINSEMSLTDTSNKNAQSSDAVSPGSNITLINASPTQDLDAFNLKVPSREVPVGEGVGDAAGTSPNKSSESLSLSNKGPTTTYPSSPSKSIAQLRRILSTSSGFGGGTLSRANTNSSRLSMTSINGANINSHTAPTTWSARQKIGRSQTELVFRTSQPMSSADMYVSTDRRSSEPDASFGLVDPVAIVTPQSLQQKRSLASGARQSFRRLGRRTSLVASPTTSLSNINGTWDERLHSVQETIAESPESSLRASKQNTPKLENRKLIGSQKS